MSAPEMADTVGGRDVPRAIVAPSVTVVRQRRTGLAPEALYMPASAL